MLFVTCTQYYYITRSRRKLRVKVREDLSPLGMRNVEFQPRMEDQLPLTAGTTQDPLTPRTSHSLLPSGTGDDSGTREGVTRGKNAGLTNRCMITGLKAHIFVPEITLLTLRRGQQNAPHTLFTELCLILLTVWKHCTRFKCPKGRSEKLHRGTA